jgi:hypothetical protein
MTEREAAPMILQFNGLGDQGWRRAAGGAAPAQGLDLAG